METSTIVVPSIVGAILTIIIPLILRQAWPRWARFVSTITITVAVSGAVILAWLKPDAWQDIAAGLASAVAVGQVVYGALKDTGLFTWIGQATEPTSTDEG